MTPLARQRRSKRRDNRQLQCQRMASHWSYLDLLWLSLLLATLRAREGKKNVHRPSIGRTRRCRSSCWSRLVA
jgi:hypothetical protein